MACCTSLKIHLFSTSSRILKDEHIRYEVNDNANKRRQHIKPIGSAHKELIVLESQSLRHQLVCSEYNKDPQQECKGANDGMGRRPHSDRLAKLRRESGKDKTP